ncbi:acetyl-CoA acetyltransferase [Caballeronia temeraria]|uniref:Acetyl-CoA acetyltransferase n=1 Tax=Caballeronia temeraria TaxID=1777137 RepID=A0A158AP01_9BURK|nr:acetyl-CoA C-acetyltransferase [Caballeronia temeraria]SAK59648.1 acetyl-CoA acetyltransferase [Caballeronia temeraria]
MGHAYIVSPLRTPVGKFGGSLAPLAAADLAAHVIRAVLERSQAPHDSVDEVIVAQSYQSSEAPCIGRYAASLAGLPEHVSGYAVDRRCGSGLQAVIDAALQVQTHAADCVVVAGVESMSNIEYYSTKMRWGARMGDVAFHDRLDRGRVNSQPVSRYGVMAGGAAETAENLARDYDIGREPSDRYAARSHQLAAQAWKEGRFDAEVVSVPVPHKKGETKLFSRDEGIREDASLDVMAKLPALLKNGTVTAGNACQQNDAASACLVVSEAWLAKHGAQPMGRFVGWAASGCDPLRMGIGPVPAVAKLLPRIGLTLKDMDLLEINEAFAVQVLSCLRAWKLEGDSRVNVNGSGISLGHPIGATGVRIMTSMLHEMARRGARYGLETMCIGGGQGLAAVFERV